MTKAPIPTEKSEKQRDNTKMPQQLRLHNDCGPTEDGQFGVTTATQLIVVKLAYVRTACPLTATAVLSKEHI